MASHHRMYHKPVRDNRKEYETFKVIAIARDLLVLLFVFS
jgi:hypothetical protein